jgi:hypothetical protein
MIKQYKIPVRQRASYQLNESYENVTGLNKTKKKDVIAMTMPNNKIIVFLK